MYYVYLLECNDGSLYAGITTDFARRFIEHQKGVGSRYTRAHGAKRMVYVKRAKNRSAASRSEAALKRLPRAQKLALVHAGKTHSKTNSAARSQKIRRSGPLGPRPTAERAKKNGKVRPSHF